MSTKKFGGTEFFQAVQFYLEFINIMAYPTWVVWPCPPSSPLQALHIFLPKYAVATSCNKVD